MLSRIKELRAEQNLSLRELASRLGIAYTSLGKYERGEQQPNMVTLCQIADYFQVTTDYLLGRTDDRLCSDSIFSEDMQNLKSAYENAPPLIKSHFANIISYISMLSAKGLKNGGDTEYIKLLEHIFCCLQTIHLAGSGPYEFHPFTAKETDEKYQKFLNEQEELSRLAKQLFYYSKWNEPINQN